MWIYPWIIKSFLRVIAWIVFFSPLGRRGRLALIWMPDELSVVDEGDLVVSRDQATIGGLLKSV
jgi:hypothetical protein